MPKLRLEVFVPKNGIADPKALMRVVENTLNEQANAVKMEFNRTTLTWKGRPEFVIDSRPGERMIYTMSDIYGFVSRGTKPHRIVPRRAKALHFFRTGFRAKSRPNSLRANKGARATKDETYSQGVNHPGNAARNFDLTIQKRWQKELPVQMQRAIDAEFRR